MTTAKKKGAHQTVGTFHVTCKVENSVHRNKSVTIPKILGHLAGNHTINLHAMSRTITVSDTLFAWLESEVQHRGLDSIEELLERWKAGAAPPTSQSQTVDLIHSLRDSLRAKYGEMPDSVPLIREDRMR